MKTMEGRLGELNDQFQAAEAKRGKLADAGDEAAARMSEGLSLRHAMARSKAAIAAEDQKIRNLEDSKEQVQRQHDRLAVKLRAAMEPRVLAIQQRMEKRRKAVASAEEGLRAWALLRKKYKAAALAKLEEKRRLHDDVRRTEDALKRAKQEEEDAIEKYESAKKGVSRDVEAYKYAETKYKAVRSKATVSEEGSRKEQQSLEKMRAIWSVEEKRNDESLAAGEERLHGRIQKEVAARSKAAGAFESSRERYAAWQTEERDRAQKAAKLQGAYKTAATLYANQRENVLRDAQARAGAQAVAASEFSSDDWAWAGSPELDDGVRLAQ